MTWSTGTGTDIKDLLDKIKADAVTHGWTVDSYQLGDGKATGLLTLSENIADTETVTIDTKVYTFQTTLTDVDGNVHIGATASDSLDNLIAAIILGAGAGTDYATSMTLHPTVTAAADAGDTMLATAKTGGTAGNSIATTETLAGSGNSWGQALLIGGLIPLEDPDILYIHGPGPTGTENVHINMKTSADIVGGKYYLEVRGAILYDSSLDFENQPGGSLPSYMLTWNGSIPYWLSVSDRRIFITTKSSTRYFSMYAGFFLPYATPVEYPYPLFISATVGVTPPIYTEVGSEIRSAVDPASLQGHVRAQGGSWVKTHNHDNFGTGDDSYDNREAGTYYTWPYYSGGTIGLSNRLRDLDVRPPSGLIDMLTPTPIEIIGDREDEGILGILEGAFFVPGFGASAEQTFNVAALAATGILTLAENVANNETVTIDGKVYTFQTVLTDVDGNVLIGATASDSLDNLIAAIGLRAGRGTTYAALTIIHPTVTVEAGAGDTMDATAKAPGTDGNSIGSTETLAGVGNSWGGATLSGGTAGDDYIIFPCVYKVDVNHFYAVAQI